MTNTIQELTVNEAWRDEQDAWNHRSEYFVEMHNREDRKAQVTEFLTFLKDENLLPAEGGAHFRHRLWRLRLCIRIST